MKMKNNYKNRTLTRTLVLVATVALIVLCVLFVKDCARYAWACMEIDSAESAGNGFTYTSRGQTSNWSLEGYTERYNAAKAAKETLINENDVARWANYSAYSVTGRVLRVLTPLLAIVIILIGGLWSGTIIFWQIADAKKHLARQKHSNNKVIKINQSKRRVAK